MYAMLLNSKNSTALDPYRLLLNLSDKGDLKEW